jgi:3-methyladenine DNA glycosylase AlkD
MKDDVETRTKSLPSVTDIRRELRRSADPADAAFLQRYFKTGPGEYGEGDRFLGVRVPQVRRVSKAGRALPLDIVITLLRSRWHEERLLALFILVERYRRGGEADRDSIFRAFLANTSRINNWDLVDQSAGRIVGAHTDPGEIGVLERLAGSDNLWERRIAMMATSHYIGQGVFGPTFRVASLLLTDPEDLIHKAVGWMLREVGKRDRAAEEAFLKGRYGKMPRTMLRYAIEKFPERRRRQYLAGEV